MITVVEKFLKISLTTSGNNFIAFEVRIWVFIIDLQWVEDEPRQEMSSKHSDFAAPRSAVVFTLAQASYSTCQVVGHRFTWQGPRPITRTMLNVPNFRSRVQVSDPASRRLVRDR